jgi:hypothetical protein
MAGRIPQHTSHDSNEMFDDDKFPEDDDPAAAGDYANSMRFPVWPGHTEPSYSGRPLLRLSAGYGRLPFAVAEYSIKYGPGLVSVSDQVLLETSEQHLRLDHMVTSKHFLNNTRSGWLEIKSDGIFEVVKGRAPVFMVSNIDTGDWQGGFRFSGIELRAWQASRAPQKYVCGTCKNNPNSLSCVSCSKPSS